jgi:hypothetical protein
MGLNLEPVPENPVKKRQIAMMVAVAAIVALGLAAFSKSWLRAEKGSSRVAMGLIRAELCDRGACNTMSDREFVKSIINDQIDRLKEIGVPGVPAKRSPASWIAGWITLVLVVLAAGSLLAAVILIAQGKFFLGPFAPTSLALLLLFLSLIAGCVFVATNPTTGKDMQEMLPFRLGVGWSFWVFGAGVVAGIAGSQLLAKFKPAEPDYI